MKPIISFKSSRNVLLQTSSNQQNLRMAMPCHQKVQALMQIMTNIWRTFFNTPSLIKKWSNRKLRLLHFSVTVTTDISVNAIRLPQTWWYRIYSGLDKTKETLNHLNLSSNTCMSCPSQWLLIRNRTLILRLAATTIRCSKLITRGKAMITISMSNRLSH